MHRWGGITSALVVWALGLSLSARAFLPLPLPLDGEETNSSLAQESWEPQSVQGFYELYNASVLREMELPSFNNPEKTLGYEGPNTFEVPEALTERVEFWKRIYTEVTSS